MIYVPQWDPFCLVETKDNKSTARKALGTEQQMLQSQQFLTFPIVYTRIYFLILFE